MQSDLFQVLISMDFDDYGLQLMKMNVLRQKC